MNDMVNLGALRGRNHLWVTVSRVTQGAKCRQSVTPRETRWSTRASPTSAKRSMTVMQDLLGAIPLDPGRPRKRLGSHYTMYWYGFLDGVFCMRATTVYNIVVKFGVKLILTKYHLQLVAGDLRSSPG